jgi:hypothetical protein
MRDPFSRKGRQNKPQTRRLDAKVSIVGPAFSEERRLGRPWILSGIDKAW